MISLRRFDGRAVLLCSALSLISLATALFTAIPASAADDLLSIYTKALDGNPEYQSAVAGYQQALEAKPQALARLLPQIGVSGDINTARQTLSGSFFNGAAGPAASNDVNRTDSFNEVGYQVGLTQVLFDKGLYISLGTAELEISRAGILTYDAQDALRLSVADAYFAALKADDELRFSTSEKEAIAALLAQTRDRAATGLVSDAELKTAQAQLDLADATLIAAQNGVSVSRAQLELLTGGQKFGRLKSLADNYTPAPPEPNRIDAWIERASTQNLQVKAQKLSTELARKDIDKAYALRWPKLGAIAAYSYQYAEGGISNGIGAEGNRAHDERVGVQLKIPIFAGGAIDSGIRAAQAGLTRAEADEAAKRNTALSKVQVAFLNSSSGIARVKALRQAVESTKASEEVTRVGYEVGTRTNSELLLALGNRYKAERDFATARYDTILNTLRLRAAAGSLNHADLLAIEQVLQ